MLVHVVGFYLLFVATQSVSAEESAVEQLVEEIFPHHKFQCDPLFEQYEAEFSFLEGLGRGFVHAERHRIYFEYYFPADHWVGFSTADQSIEGHEDQCSACYFKNYYPLPAIANRSNLSPKCVEECLDETIFVATVNSDEENINNWNLIEVQIAAQESKKLQRKMYRIPPANEILEIWGSSYSPYREDAHFETNLYKIGEGENEKEYIHAKFWRKYDFAPNSDLDEYDESNEWSAFVFNDHIANGLDLYYANSLCFITIASFFGGEYPFDDDAVEGLLPGFYIDTDHLANIHCYPLDEIKVDCGQNWSWMTMTKKEHEEAEQNEANDDSDAETDDLDTEYMENTDDTDADLDDLWTDDTDTDLGDTNTEIMDEVGSEYDNDIGTEYDFDIAVNIEPISTTVNKVEISTTSTTSSSTSSTSSSSLQPLHGEDCCSAISGISYDDIHCLNISKSGDSILNLEEKWKSEQCGRLDKLPTDLSEGIANSANNESDCDHLWAYFNQIHEICYKYAFTKNGMKVYNHFKSRGGYECFGKNSDECKAKEAAIEEEEGQNHDGNWMTFNNFAYDEEESEESEENEENEDASIETTQFHKLDKKESELAEMEEDGGLTITSLGVLGLIIVALTLYVLYWFCCSTSSKGYRQSSQFMDGGGYYEDDMDTDDIYYSQRRRGYNKYDEEEQEDEENGNNHSDWSEDEQLGVIDDDHNKMEISGSKKKKHCKKKKKKKKKNREVEDVGYDVSVHDIHSMQISSDQNNHNNDAVEINVKDDDDDDGAHYFYYDDAQNETLPNRQEIQQNDDVDDEDQEEIDYQDQ